MSLIQIKIYLKYQLCFRFFLKFFREIKIDGLLKLFFSNKTFFITVVVYFIYLTNEGKGGNNVNSYNKYIFNMVLILFNFSHEH